MEPRKRRKENAGAARQSSKACQASGGGATHVITKRVIHMSGMNVETWGLRSYATYRVGTVGG